MGSWVSLANLRVTRLGENVTVSIDQNRSNGYFIALSGFSGAL
jgi:hypothetical protein